MTGHDLVVMDHDRSRFHVADAVVTESIVTGHYRKTAVDDGLLILNWGDVSHGDNLVYLCRCNTVGFSLLIQHHRGFISRAIRAPPLIGSGGAFQLCPTIPSSAETKTTHPLCKRSQRPSGHVCCRPGLNIASSTHVLASQPAASPPGNNPINVLCVQLTYADAAFGLKQTWFSTFKQNRIDGSQSRGAYILT